MPTAQLGTVTSYQDWKLAARDDSFLIAVMMELEGQAQMPSRNHGTWNRT